jgi:peroxiredoxin
VRLGDSLAKGPVELSFYRGGWCPYCNLELRALQKALREITRLGAQLVAVSPQTPDESLSTAEKNQLGFTVLSEVGSMTAKAYGIAFDLAEELRPLYTPFGHALLSKNGDDSWVLPIAATDVIDSDGTVALAFVDVDYRNRLEPAEIIAALQRLSQKAFERIGMSKFIVITGASKGIARAGKSVDEREFLVRIRGSVRAGAVCGFGSTRVGGASCGYAGKVLSEEQIERPIERDVDFLFKARQLA